MKIDKRLKTVLIVASPFAAAGGLLYLNVSRNLIIRNKPLGFEMLQAYTQSGLDFEAEFVVQNRTWFDIESMDFQGAIYSGTRFRIADVSIDPIPLPKEQTTEFVSEIKVPYAQVLRYFGDIILNPGLIRATGFYLKGSVRLKIKGLPIPITVPVFMKMV